MFSTSDIVIEAFIDRLKSEYTDTYGVLDSSYSNVITRFGKLSLENIANSDAPYHDLDHTIMVTEVMQNMLWGKHLTEGNVSASDWLHCTIAALCHDIGYVRGACKEDKSDQFVISQQGKMVRLPSGSTDAALSPWHVERSIMFVQQWMEKTDEIDENRIVEMIDFTRFPPPEIEKYQTSAFSYPAMLRASDLIGQMGDINYMKKSAALFAEFQETGKAKELGYQNASDVRKRYPSFFWNVVKPIIQPYLKYMRATEDGKQWLSNLYAHILVEQFSDEKQNQQRNVTKIVDARKQA